MKSTETKWILLALGAAFWFSLGFAGPIFKTVHGISDLSPTLFLVFSLPAWVLAASAITKHDAMVATIGGFVLAALCSTFHIPLHVRALYWQDACDSRDVQACYDVADYYRNGYSPIGGFVDANRYSALGDALSGVEPQKKAIVTYSLQTACLDNNMSACSRWIDRGIFEEQQSACLQIVKTCNYSACDLDRERCSLILERWPY